MAVWISSSFSAAARLLLEGGRHALSKTARVVLLGTMDEFSRRSNRLLFEAGLVRVRADIGTAAAVFVRSGAVTNLDWLEFGDAHRVSFNQLGKMGRFANQAFQAAFTILYGRCNEARPVFPETYATNSLPEIARWCTGPLQFPRFQVGNDLLEKAIWAVDDPPVDIDFTGYFQNTPAVWRRHRDLLRRLISPPLAVAEAARQAAGRLQAKYGKLLVIHIRRGDAVGSPYPLFRTVPADWVGEFIQRMREEHGNIAVYIATDDPHWVLAHLSHCEVLIAASVLENPDIDRALFDFSMLKHADIMGCANSSFSKMASLLAEEGQIVFLPSFYRNRYEPYDPWSVDPFWTPFVYLSEADMLRYNSRHRMWLRCLGLT